MKRIIDGKSYNTHTATEIVMVHHPEYSDGWWALYQTRHGAFFEVRVNHDGEEILDFRPMTDEEALEIVQKRAPHLVDQYFGPFPEGGAAERRLTIRIPGNLADRIETTAKDKGLSLNNFAMRCFEQYADAADAAKAIEMALSALERLQREPDVWESGYLALAINEYLRGIYRLAVVSARTALTPIDQRGDKGPADQAGPFSLAVLRKAFAEVQDGPVPQFPQFGPIRFLSDQI